MPHAPLGIFNVSFVAWDEVYMDMKDALSGRWPHINANIVAIRTKLLINNLFFLLNKLHAGGHFFLRQVEKAGDMPTRDDQGVPRARRVGITGTVSKFMLY